MLDIKIWMAAYIEAVRAAFGDRVRYIGLQGSRGRGEAGPDSDIDVVCILDTCALRDLETYRAAVADLPDRDKLCGFVSGTAELGAWDSADLFQFRHDTTDWYGHLSDLLPPEREEDARRALHTGACGLYHLCCHNFLHGQSLEAVAEAYKSAVFLVQAKTYLKQGVYCRRRADLARHLTGIDLEILQTAQALKAGECRGDLTALTDRLLTWCRGVICPQTPL
ncbi:nucleotidyltransferase domain-containing protein [uncultured Oscillibacter sp.]|uniref:nucleotidyltransferase domain-containing protein n=1 Tax=uncultured Oscillibacter sp. TaxID=876091 RepID=UPI002804A08A|nr:nucleotidyltransferase domain-containing protein [uncultured Oscillibacter sp.]